MTAEKFDEYDRSLYLALDGSETVKPRSKGVPDLMAAFRMAR